MNVPYATMATATWTDSSRLFWSAGTSGSIEPAVIVIAYSSIARAIGQGDEAQDPLVVAVLEVERTSPSVPQANATENSYMFANGPWPIAMVRKMSEALRKAKAS